jgi:hypothetical protein
MAFGHGELTPSALSNANQYVYYVFIDSGRSLPSGQDEIRLLRENTELGPATRSDSLKFETC